MQKIQKSYRLNMPVFPAGIDYLKGFGVGLIAVSFTYGGYQQTINFGSDIEKPGRNIPRAIFMGMFIIIILYLSINYAYIRVIGLDQTEKYKGHRLRDGFPCFW